MNTMIVVWALVNKQLFIDIDIVAEKNSQFVKFRLIYSFSFFLKKIVLHN